MIKKLTLLAMAVGALVAFAVPAAASATPLFTNINEEEVHDLTAFSSNTTTTSAAGTLACNHVDLSFPNITTPSTGTADGSGTGIAKHTGAPGENCTLNGQPIVKITQVDVTNIHLNNNGTGTAAFTYAYEVPVAGLKCHFESEGAATVAYETGTDKLKVEGKLKGKTMPGSSGPCAAAAELKGDFTLTDTSGNPVTIH